MPSRRLWSKRPTGHRLFPVLIAVLLLSLHLHAQDAVPVIAIPRPDVFFGAANSAITPANIDQNLCKKGWSTSSIRLPTSYTSALKKVQLKSLGYTVPNPLPRVKTKRGKTTRSDTRKFVEHSANPSCWEEGHLISRQLGGDPRSPDNLWPEPWSDPWNAGMKDTLEGKLQGDGLCEPVDGHQAHPRRTHDALETADR